MDTANILNRRKWVETGVENFSRNVDNRMISSFSFGTWFVILYSAQVEETDNFIPAKI